MLTDVRDNIFGLIHMQVIITSKSFPEKKLWMFTADIMFQLEQEKKTSRKIFILN